MIFNTDQSENELALLTSSHAHFVTRHLGQGIDIEMDGN